MGLVLKTCTRLSYAIPTPFRQWLAGTETAVLLYHGVPRTSPVAGKYAFDARAFERHIVHLKRHFDFLHPRDIFLPRTVWCRKAVVLTFDDGFCNHATVAAPILERHGIPAVFFVCNCREPVLWFSYLRALEHRFSEPGFVFRGEYHDMAADKREHTVARLRSFLLGLKPHPSAMYRVIREELPPLESFLTPEQILDWYAPMTEEQVAELDAHELFEVESHTVDHPFLTRCDAGEALRQVAENKTYLERVCNKRVAAVCYPSGDYDQTVLEICKRAGFERGYAVRPRVSKDPRFEIPRLGIYQPLEEVPAFKAMWGQRGRLY